MKFSICGQPSNDAPRDECEKKCAKLRSEMEEMRQDRRRMKRSGNSRMISRRWKSERTTTRTNFSQAEDRANDEEQEYRAEAEAFEKLCNEYNLNVKELEIW